jgi:hypothetical protein
MLKVCRCLDCSTVEVQRKEQVLKITGGYEPTNIYNADKIGLFFRVPPNKTPSFKGDPCNGAKNSKYAIGVLSTCDASQKA